MVVFFTKKKILNLYYDVNCLDHIQDNKKLGNEYRA